MAVDQTTKTKKEIVTDQERDQVHYKLPWRARMHRALRGSSPTHLPPDSQPPAYQAATLELSDHDDNVWGTRRPLCSMLGVKASKLWHCPGDIYEDDEEEYLQALTTARYDAKALRIEVMFCVRLNLINRFVAVYNVLHDTHGVDYSAIEFQTEYEDNLLMSAFSFRAYKVVDYLVAQTGNHLLMEPSSTPVFHGGTALHVALLRGCPTLVEMSMEVLNETQRLEFMNIFGDGDFFSAHDSCYSVPLLLALKTGQVEIFMKLVDYGGDPTVTDPHNGNGAIHAITLYGKQQPDKAADMLHVVLNHETMKRWFCKHTNMDYCKFTQVEALRMRHLLIDTENFAGYSPLTHAALHGVIPIVQSLLHMEGAYKRCIWSMGASSLCHYDMTEVDPTVRDLMGHHKPSVLEMLLYERPDDDIPPLAMEPLRHLMRSKWNSWKLVYIFWGLWHLVSITTYTLFCIYGNATETNRTIPDNSTGLHTNTQQAFTLGHPVARKATEINIWILVCIYLLVTITDNIQSLQLYVRGRLLWPGSGHYFVPWSVVRKYDDFNMHLTIFSILAFVSLIRLIPRPDIHNVVTGFGILEGWYFVLFFTRAFRHTSLFTVMTNRMFHLDLLRFSIIALIHIISFGSCLMILLSPNPPEEMNSIATAPHTMFLIMVGFADLSFLTSPTTPWVAKIVGVFFVITATVLLLNLLIAAMGNTYTSVSRNKDGIWLKMRVRSVLLLDRFLHWGPLRQRMMGNDIFFWPDAKRWILKVDNTHAEVGTESLWDSIIRSFTRG